MSDEETNVRNHDEGENEEGIQDWTTLNKQFASINIHDESLPKRSDKDFDLDGSTVQQSSLDIARQLMFQALDHVRGHHTKQLLVGVWIADKGKTLVPHAKGTFFKDMGTAHVFKNKEKLQGMWLSPIETVYLTERGSLIMYLGNESFQAFLETPEQEFDYDSLLQLSLSHLYSLAFGQLEGLADKYQVYAMMKRLGYIVMEFCQLTSQYESLEKLQAQKETTFQKMLLWFASIGFFSTKPFNYRTRHYFDYTQVYKSMQIIPSYSAFETLKTVPLPDPRYTLAFNVWKPTPSFSKKKPPTPEFQVSVVNIAKVPFPSLSAIQSMFNEINFSFEKETPKKKNTKPKKPQPPTKRDVRMQRKKEREAKLDPRILERNNYLKLRDAKLKTGSSGRSVVLASIDSGVISFNTLHETEFKLTTKLGVKDLSAIYPKESHGTVWNEPLKLH